MGRGWGERPVPRCLGGPSRGNCSSPVVSLSSNCGRLAFAAACVVLDQSSVRHESWGKEMTDLTHVGETHRPQEPWGSVIGLGHLRAASKGAGTSQLPSVAFPQGSFKAGPEMEFTEEEWGEAK